jgi:hypothetical protein
MELDPVGLVTAAGTALALVLRAITALVKVARERRSCTCDCHDIPGCRRHAPELVS